MVKIFAFSDAHLGASRYNLKWFSEELRKAFLDMLHKAKDLNVDAIVFCGDLFDTPFVNVKEILFAIQAFRSVNIPTYLIIGNHDLQSGRPLEESPVKLVEESCNNVHIIDKGNVHIYDLNVIGIPYITPAEFLEYTSHTLMLERYYKLLDNHSKNIALLHQDVLALEYAKYIPTALKLDALEPFDYCLIGHYHDKVEHERFAYIGSTYPLSFKQARVDKGGYLVTVTDDDVELQFHPVTKIQHKLKEIRITYDEFDNSILEKEIENGYDVIRIVFEMKEDQLPYATLLAKDLRKIYGSQLEKLMIDYDITNKSKEVDSTFDDIAQDIHDTSIFSYKDLLVKLTEADNDLVHFALDKLEGYEIAYKSESKQIEQAVKLLLD